MAPRARTLAVATLVVLMASSAMACSPPTAQPPCNASSGVGGAVPTGLGPGDVVDAVELTGADRTSPGFPTGARAWRVLYVSTGADEHQLQLVCGLVALPAAGPRATAGRGRLLAWSHGTIGLDQRCLPSSDPARHMWAPMPDGIGAIAWGSLLGKHEGETSGGALQYAMDQGWVVTMADYQPNDTYVMGKVAAGNVLDAARAGTQLAGQTFPDTAPDSYKMITWGHSQGGHAAIWAGQLAEGYLAATTPSKPTATLELAGVAALAPASNFVTQRGQPGVAPGDGLADQEMHQSVEVIPLPIPALETQIGPALFSFIFGSWAQYSAQGAPGADAAYPAYPPADADLPLDAVATAEGRRTISTVQPLCLSGPDAAKINAAVAPYRNAGAHAMLPPELWNLPAGYSEGEYFRGGIDASCEAVASEPAKDPGLGAWCDWIRWNMPGPLGVNPFPKAPEVGGRPVPMLIGQGADDQVIHCQPAGGAAGGDVPPAADCMSGALYDSLESAQYCPDGSAKGHLQLDVFREVPFETPSTHFAIPGQMSARRIGRSAADLTFEGSPMQRFMVGAFDGTLEPGCTAAVMNP